MVTAFWVFDDVGHDLEAVLNEERPILGSVQAAVVKQRLLLGHCLSRLAPGPSLKPQLRLRALTDLLLAQDRLVDLSPVDRDALGMLDPEPHLVPPDLDHRQDDVVVDDDALAFLAWDDDHG